MQKVVRRVKRIGVLSADEVEVRGTIRGVVCMHCTSVVERAFRAAAKADLRLAIGTRLQVYRVAGMVPAAEDSGARVVMNAGPALFDDIADAVLRDPIGEALPRLCASLSPR